MGKFPYTSASPERNLIQELNLDGFTSQIKVVHEVNLSAGYDAEWQEPKEYIKADNPDVFRAKCIFYELEYNDHDMITEFIYNENDRGPNYDRVRFFPGPGEHYLVSPPEQVVAVCINRRNPPDLKEKTNGPAAE